jgi:D-glycero-D-manno-heptose 1,7-bisphosphate phosphatase
MKRDDNFHKAIFLDKDGTLIPDIPYNVDPAMISLSEGVIEGLRLLKESGYIFIIASNQSGLAQGYFKEQDFENMQKKITELLSVQGIVLSGFYYCPHHPLAFIEKYASDCECHKPKPGLLLQAAHELTIDLTSSWMIGDILNDVEAGKSAGCKSILIENGNETEWKLNEKRKPDYIAANLPDAAGFILKYDSPCVLTN